VVITFDRDVNKVDLEDINNGTIEIKKKLLPAFQVEVTPGLDSDLENLKFEWTAVEMTTRTLTLQLMFEKPMYVSVYDWYDRLKVTFNDSQLFYSENGSIIHPRDRVLTERIPPLLPNGVESTLMNVFSSIVVVAEATAFAGSFFFTWLLNNIWSIINTQQLIVLFPLFDVTLPGNAKIFYQALMKIAAFEMFEIGDTVNELLSLEPTGAVNDNYETLGFESTYFINNVGTMLFYYLLFPALMLADWVIQKMSGASRSC